MQRGFRHQSAGNKPAAEADYRKVLALDPANPDAHFLLGSLLGEAGRLIEAQQHLQQAIVMRPGFVDAQTALGNVHLLGGNGNAAKDCYAAAIRLDPLNATAHSNLGLACQGLADHSGALAAFERACELAPGLPGLIRNLTIERLILEQYKQSETHLRHLLTARADDFDVLLSLAFTLQKSHRPYEALEYYQRAQRQNNADPELLNNLGIVFQDLGRLEEAMDCYDAAIAAKPGFELARWHRSLCRLLQHDFARGWLDYDVRLQSKDRSQRVHDHPVWLGGDASMLRLLVYGEQGLGDEIMFASCLPELLAASKHCVIECSEKLLPLFRRSFPEAEVRAASRGGGLPVDAQIAMGSLPRYLRKSLADFPAHRGYLKADPVRGAVWRKRLDALGAGLKIGISWHGGTHKTRAPLRSVPLAEWGPLLKMGGHHFVDLQYTDCAEEIALFEEKSGVRIHRWREVREDFEETASLVAELDLVISVCTAVIHLAGALGKPVWIMAPFSPEWRYGFQGETMPWYPSSRLFRQPGYGQWQPVIADVAKSLSVWPMRHTDVQNREY